MHVFCHSPVVLSYELSCENKQSQALTLAIRYGDRVAANAISGDGESD